MTDLKILHKHDIDKAAKQSVCYFLFYHGQLVYIGETDYLDGRIMAHKKDKIFDSVSKIDVEINTKKGRIAKEMELIREFHPILCGQYQCAPQEAFLIIDDALFTAQNRMSFYLDSTKLLSPEREHVGYIKNNVLCYLGSGAIFHHNLNTNEIKLDDIRSWGKNKRASWDEYIYCEEDHKIYLKKDFEEARRYKESKKCTSCGVVMYLKPGMEWKTMCYGCYSALKKRNNIWVPVQRACEVCGNSFMPVIEKAMMCLDCYGKIKSRISGTIKKNVSNFNSQ